MNDFINVEGLELCLADALAINVSVVSVAAASCSAILTSYENLDSDRPHL